MDTSRNIIVIGAGALEGLEAAYIMELAKSKNIQITNVQAESLVEQIKDFNRHTGHEIYADFLFLPNVTHLTEREPFKLYQCAGPEYIDDETKDWFHPSVTFGHQKSRPRSNKKIKKRKKSRNGKARS